MPITSFISYARIDKDYVEPIYNFLLESGILPWMDIYNLLPGENWEEAITKRIKDSDVFIAILTENSISRRGVIQKELKLALDKIDYYLPNDIFIIPIRLDKCKIPDRLSHIQVLDWDSGKGKSKLLESLKTIQKRMGENKENGIKSSQQMSDWEKYTSILVESFFIPTLRLASPYDSISQALLLMEMANSNHIPVVNTNKNPVGVISKIDVLRFVDFEKNSTSQIMVRDIMTAFRNQNAPILYSSETLFSAIKKFLTPIKYSDQGKGHFESTFLVINPENGQIIGIADFLIIIQTILQQSLKYPSGVIEKYMTFTSKISAVRIDSSYEEIYQVIMHSDTRIIIVIDAENNIKGLITDSSVHFHLSQSRTRQITAKDLMFEFTKSTTNGLLKSNGVIKSAMEMFIRYPMFTALPIFKSDNSEQLSGLISYLDIFKGIIDEAKF